MSYPSAVSTLRGIQQSPQYTEFLNACRQANQIVGSPYTLKTEDVQRAYDNFSSLYNRIANVMNSCLRQIGDTPPSSIEDITFASMETKSKIDEYMEKFTHKILDRYPTTKVDYRAKCIGTLIPINESYMFKIHGKGPRSEALNEKLQKLATRYPIARDVLGDGNCFLSSFIASYIEYLVKERKIGEFVNFVCENPDIGNQDLRNEILNMLATLEAHPSQMERFLADNHKTLPLIKYFRLIAADEMKKNPQEFYAHSFALSIENLLGKPVGEKTYETLVEQHVATMGEHFIDESLTALARRLQFPLQIVDYERDKVYLSHDGQKPLATIGRKTWHYFNLYAAEGTESHMPFQRTVPLGETLFLFGPEHDSFARSHAGDGFIPCTDDTGLIREHQFPGGITNNRIFYSQVPLSDIDYDPLLRDARLSRKEYERFLPQPVSESEYQSFIDRDTNPPWPLPPSSIEVKMVWTPEGPQSKVVRTGGKPYEDEYEDESLFFTDYRDEKAHSASDIQLGMLEQQMSGMRINTTRDNGEGKGGPVSDSDEPAVLLGSPVYSTGYESPRSEEFSTDSDSESEKSAIVTTMEKGKDTPKAKFWFLDL